MAPGGGEYATSVRQLIRCGIGSCSAVAWRYVQRHLRSPWNSSTVTVMTAMR